MTVIENLNNEKYTLIMTFLLELLIVIFVISCTYILTCTVLQYEKYDLLYTP
jgi:hypothetical protein